MELFDLHLRRLSFSAVWSFPASFGVFCFNTAHVPTKKAKAHAMKRLPEGRTPRGAKKPKVSKKPKVFCYHFKQEAFAPAPKSPCPPYC